MTAIVFFLYICIIDPSKAEAVKKEEGLVMNVKIVPLVLM